MTPDFSPRHRATLVVHNSLWNVVGFKQVRDSVWFPSSWHKALHWLAVQSDQAWQNPSLQVAVSRSLPDLLLHCGGLVKVPFKRHSRLLSIIPGEQDCEHRVHCDQSPHVGKQIGMHLSDWIEHSSGKFSGKMKPSCRQDLLFAWKPDTPHIPEQLVVCHSPQSLQNAWLHGWTSVAPFTRPISRHRAGPLATSPLTKQFLFLIFTGGLHWSWQAVHDLQFDHSSLHGPPSQATVLVLHSLERVRFWSMQVLFHLWKPHKHSLFSQSRHSLHNSLWQSRVRICFPVSSALTTKSSHSRDISVHKKKTAIINHICTS